MAKNKSENKTNSSRKGGVGGFTDKGSRGDPTQGEKGRLEGRARKMARARRQVKEDPNQIAALFVPKIESDFDRRFAGTEQFALKRNLRFDLGSLGEYALCHSGRKAIVRIVEEPKYKAKAGEEKAPLELRIHVIESSFVMSTNVFIAHWQVVKTPIGNFVSNSKLDALAQEEQKMLHAFLRECLDQQIQTLAEEQVRIQAKMEVEAAQLAVQVEQNRKPSKVKMDRPALNRYSIYAQDRTISSNMLEIVSSKLGIFRIADEFGKFAVLSKTTNNANLDQVIVMIRIQYMEPGHTLEGKVEVGKTYIKLESLKKEHLGEPFGPNAEKMVKAQSLHQFIRERALAAGIKPKVNKHPYLRLVSKVA